MPLTPRAIKKLRHDRVRTKKNDPIRRTLQDTIKQVRKKPGKSGLSKAYKIIDKAVKRRIIHANKAGRLKSRLAHIVAG